MRGVLAAHLLAAALIVRPNCAVADDVSCPMEQVVATVLSVAGDPTKMHFKRALPRDQKDAGERDDVPVTSGTHICFGDRLEVGPEAVVSMETMKGKRHIGGSYDPVFQAPQASEDVSPGAMSYLASLYNNIFNKSGLTVYATGRGLEQCAPGDEEASFLVPLDRLSQTRQQIGADLAEIVAAWKPSLQPHSVRATLRGRDGNAIAQADTCGSAHVTLPLRPGDLHPNDILTLEIVDRRGQRLTYELTVVLPQDLPIPPVALPSQWLIAAWRLAAGPPETRLDSIARLQSAPPDALAPRKISEAVWIDSKF